MNKLSVAILSFILLASSAAVAADTIVFIVNAANPTTKLSTAEVKDFFLKRKRKWSDGLTVRFIDRNNSPERKIFLETIMKQSSEDVDLYWIGQKLYSGDSAPVKGSSDSMVIHFVSTFKDALGYVSASTPIKNKDVKTITVGN